MLNGVATASTARRSSSGASAEVPYIQRLPPEVVDLMAETVLRRTPDGQWYEICCPRDYEGHVYEYLLGWAMKVHLNKVSRPVKVIGSDPTVPVSFTPSMNLAELIGLDYTTLPMQLISSCWRSPRNARLSPSNSRKTGV